MQLLVVLLAVVSLFSVGYSFFNDPGDTHYSDTSVLLNVGILVIHALYIVLSITIIILLLLMLFQLVYALMFIQPSPFMNAPVVYGVLSLIPSAAISFVNWLLKTKVYQLDFAKHLKITQTT